MVFYQSLLPSSKKLQLIYLTSHFSQPKPGLQVPTRMEGQRRRDPNNRRKMNTMQPKLRYLPSQGFLHVFQLILSHRIFLLSPSPNDCHSKAVGIQSLASLFRSQKPTPHAGASRAGRRETQQKKKGDNQRPSFFLHQDRSLDKREKNLDKTLPLSCLWQHHVWSKDKTQVHRYENQIQRQQDELTRAVLATPAHFIQETDQGSKQFGGDPYKPLVPWTYFSAPQCSQDI